jgi:hypothetical protein
MLGDSEGEGQRGMPRVIHIGNISRTATTSLTFQSGVEVTTGSIMRCEKENKDRDRDRSDVLNLQNAMKKQQERQ